ncbi:hypothetical protein A2U01_0004576, partial [Trifolium medium]|nr:hypothetical protein [Trifolium medium]
TFWRPPWGHGKTIPGLPLCLEEEEEISINPWQEIQHQITVMERAEEEAGSDEESFAESQPLNQTLWDARVPDNFKAPHLPTFEGKSDPSEHLMAVGTQTAIIGAAEHLKCKILSGTFKDAALR